MRHWLYLHSLAGRGRPAHKDLVQTAPWMDTFVSALEWSDSGRGQLEARRTELRALLELLLSVAEAAHREVRTLTRPVFAGEVGRCAAEHCGAENVDALLETVQALHLGDFYVTTACLHGDSEAREILDESYLVPAIQSLRGQYPPIALDQVRHEIRGCVLLGPSKPTADGPGIGSYRAERPLASWIRSLAAGAAGEFQRSARKVANTARDSEVDRSDINARYGAICRGLIREIVANLGERDRTILRLYTVHRVSTHSLGAMQGVSAKTVQTWLGDTTGKVRASVRRRLSEKFHVADEELDAVVTLAMTGLPIALEAPSS